MGIRNVLAKLTEVERRSLAQRISLFRKEQETFMSTETILIILLVVFLLGGGGWYYSRG